MTEVLKMSRKALTVGVVLTTLAWSMMATVLVAPLKASAAGCTSGSLVKGSLSAVYYCGGDGKRYVFTNDKAYFTWYSDFSGVMKIADSDLAALQIGGNVTYRPGVKMIKIQTDPKVYAVSKNGNLRPIASEAVAAALYGSTWNKQIDDVSDAFFTNYSVGSAISAAADFDKSAEMSGAQTINADKNLSGSSSSTGTVMAAVASDNPSATTLPSSSTGVNFLKFTLSNGGTDAKSVYSVTLHRTGPGATTDLSAVYLYEGATRLTTSRTVNSSTNDVIFTGLGLALAAGQTRTLWVAVDVAAGVSGVHSLQLKAIDAGGATVGGLPINGNTMTLTTTNVGSLTIAKTGTITNPKVGQTNVQVAQFSIAGGTGEDVWLNRITLYQAGGLAASHLTNLKLVQAGNTVATATGVDSKLHVVFNLVSPMAIAKGATKNFEVFGDVAGAARVDDTIKLYVEESSDVYAVGATYGYGVTVTKTTYDGDSCTSSSGYCSYSAVEGGQITVSLSGPSSTSYSSGAKDRELFNFTLASQSNVEVKKIVLVVDCTPASTLGGCHSGTLGSTANYTDVKITNVATGQVWWGPLDLTTASDTQNTLTFTDVQTLAAGSSTSFKVTADVKSTVPNNDAVTVTLSAFGSTDIRNLDNNTFVATTAIVPSGAIAGNQHTILAPSLAISMASTPLTASYVKGSTSVPFLGVNLSAGGGADIKVTAMTLKGYIDAVEASLPGSPTMVQGFDDNGTSDVAVIDDILSCKLFDGSTQIGDSKSPTTSSTEGSGGLLQFTNLNYTVPASGIKSLTLKCDISNSAYRNSDSEVIGFAVQAASDVTAQDPDGSSVDPSGTANATAASVRIGITDAGTITVAQAPDDSESEQSLVVAGSSSAVLGKFRFTAANEELKLVKLTTYLATTASNRSVTTLSLYDGSTLLAGPVSLTTGSASATAVFSGMNLVIPKNGSKTVTVKGAINSIAGGAVSGDDVKVRLYIPGLLTIAGTPNTTNTTAYEVRGTQSSTVIRNATDTGTDTLTSGNSKLVRKTKPTVSLASLPTTTLTNGGGVIATRFTVTADAAEQVSLKKVSFKVSMHDSSDVIASPAVREVGQGSDISASGTVQIDGTGSSTAGCGFLSTPTAACVTVAFTSEQVIAAGTSKTYELRLTTSGFDSTDSMSTYLLGDAADSVPDELDGTLGSGLLVTGDTSSNFIWSDNSVVAHSDTITTGSADWTNGWLVKVLPADAQTLSL